MSNEKTKAKVVRRLRADLDKQLRVFAKKMGVSMDEALAAVVTTGLKRRAAVSRYVEARS